MSYLSQEEKSYRRWRTIWTLAALIPAVWILIGLVRIRDIFEITGPAADVTRRFIVEQAFLPYLITGLPLLLLFAFLAWRNNAALVREIQHQDMMDVMEGNEE